MGLIQSCKLWIAFEDFFIYLNTPDSGGRKCSLKNTFDWFFCVEEFCLKQKSIFISQITSKGKQGGLT